MSRSDIFILNVTDTGSTTTATAEVMFQGQDVGLDTWQESVWAMSLVAGDESLAETSFKQGTSGYSGTLDTTLNEGDPNESEGSGDDIAVDLDDGAGDETTQGLIRFDGIFGSVLARFQPGPPLCRHR